MTYNQYLFSCLYKNIDTDFADAHYEEQYKRIPAIYKEFQQSGFNDPNKSMYVCITDWLDSLEWVNSVECSCGEWEEIPHDSPRHHIKGFDWLSNCDDGTAYYQCPECGDTVHSKIVRN